ncbi:MAG TPA: sigma-54 dependent transcriptional regulator [Gemmatimonadales bacterium]|nr:sigma-54 dependent transcriptional regulator [Gemmatimonadales bacterium]
MRPHSLLVVDDDATVRHALADALSDDNTEVTLADSAEGALALIGAGPVDVVLSDIRMPGLDGLKFLKLLRERARHIDVVLMTAFDDMPTVVAAMREGAVEFLVKPLELHALRRVLDGVFEDRRARARRQARPEEGPVSLPGGYPGALVGHDPRMVDVFKRIGQAACSRATVLIRGETGTGKELIARAIHSSSSESDTPFVAVNCAALPATLLESELFGHVRGAFTGATGDRKGRFALAGRGTIFLDEIGDTTVDLQAKLLRVLQEREFYPVGAEQPERTAARVIAATHQNLESLVAAGTFRADLYYRLRVLEIDVPPLRDRVADVPPLALHLTRRASRAAGRKAPVLSQEALDVLVTHDWPGNVRELENCLTRAVVLASGDVVRAEHITIGKAASVSIPAPVTLEALERSHVEHTLAALDGHKAKTARALGISRPRLDRLLRKYGLE